MRIIDVTGHHSRLIFVSFLEYKRAHPEPYCIVLNVKCQAMGLWSFNVVDQSLDYNRGVKSKYFDGCFFTPK